MILSRCFCLNCAAKLLLLVQVRAVLSYLQTTPPVNLEFALPCLLGAPSVWRHKPSLLHLIITDILKSPNALCRSLPLTHR